MRIRRVIEATKGELIGLIQEKMAEEVALADPENPRKRTAKEREAHDAAAKALEWVVNTLEDWKIQPDEAGSDGADAEPNGSAAHASASSTG